MRLKLIASLLLATAAVLPASAQQAAVPQPEQVGRVAPHPRLHRQRPRRPGVFRPAGDQVARLRQAFQEAYGAK